ncbi:M14 family metallopeptidase [Fulvivirgaceae bacterium LMO-SS25]
MKSLFKSFVLGIICLGISLTGLGQIALPNAGNIPTYNPADKKVWPGELLTTPEKTAYLNTSTYNDVREFLEYVNANSPLTHLEYIGKSESGREIPLIILSDPKVSTPEEAQATGKSTFYIQANIHGGEVEGKEAVMILMREILFGDKKHLLDNQIILIAPVYNIDGNDNMGDNTRPSQEGSPMTAGTRANGAGLDLNRDGMKLEGSETKALLENVILKWDPQLLVDLHTTNGTWHGYSLTWAPSYHSAGQYEPYDYTWNNMLPEITQTVYEKYDLHFGPFGDYYGLRRWPVNRFSTYNHHPRYLVNQMGLRNKLGILSENFAHERFYQRIYAAHAFVNEILEFTNRNAAEITQLNKKAEQDAINAVIEGAGVAKKGVRYQMVAMDELLNLRTYNYGTYINQKGDSVIYRTGEIVNLEGVEYYAKFDPTVEATIPRGYVFSQELSHIADMLKSHGVKVTQLEKNQNYTGEEFHISKVNKANRPFEGHNMVTLEGEFKAGNKRFSKGDYVVDAAQPLANLIFYLLEPQSDDGLTTWNFFDDQIGEGNTVYPIFKYFK